MNNNFDYTQFHFFDKSGIELPISLQSSYEIVLKNDHEDNAVFYGLFNTSNEFEKYLKISSGNRFSGINPVPGILKISDKEFNINASVEYNRTSSNVRSEYYIDSINSVEFPNTDIEDVNEVLDTLRFPSVTFKSSLAFKEISVDLIETQSIYILVEKDNNFIKPAEHTGIGEWTNRYKLLFFIDNRNQENFRFFNVSSNELVWTNKELVDLTSTDEKGFKVNIGFTATEEGVYEQELYVCLIDTHNEDDEQSWDLYPIGEISLAAEAIGEDERYRALFANFGIPDPITYDKVFANTSNEEGKTDYMKLNENSKKMFLAYSEIFPYVGTYKALANAVHILGYDDIFFKEWYKEIGKTIQNTSLVSYDVSYLSDKNANTIENVSIEERLSLRKLNWLSMVYRINKMLDDVEDRHGFPGVEDVYSFNNTEIVPKLYSLKKWLEKYIIGLHCKIIDITGEGIYFERYRLATYGSYQQIFDWNNEKNLIPYIDTTINDTLEETDTTGILVDGSANIKIDVGLNTNSTIEEYKAYRFSDFVDGYLNNNYIYYNDLPHDENDAKMFIGKTFECLNDFSSYKVKAITSGEDFIFGKDLIASDSASLMVSNNEIFFSPLDLITREKQTAFTVLPVIQLERANIRKVTDAWINTPVYRIYPDLRDDTLESYFISSDSKTAAFVDYVTLIPPSWDSSVEQFSENTNQTIVMHNEFYPNVEGTEIDDETEDSENSINSLTYDKITLTTISGKTIERDSIEIPEYVSDNMVDTEHNTSYIDVTSMIRFAKNIRTYGLRYSANNDLHMPLFSIIGYEIDGLPDFINSTEEYCLEIIDGKMIFNDKERNRTIYLNFNYDFDNNVQEIKVNIVYESEEFKIESYSAGEGHTNVIFFPGYNYSYFLDLYKINPDNCIAYNNIYELTVHNTGKYNVDVYAKDKHNNIFAKNCENYAYVYMHDFALNTYTNTSNSDNDFNINGRPLTVEEKSAVGTDYVDFCIYKNSYFIKDLKKEISDITGSESITVTYPTYSYSMYTPGQNDYLHFMNIADKYTVAGMNYSYSTTSETNYKGYYLTLTRDTSNFKYKVVDRNDENAVAAQYSKYGYGYVENAGERISDILYTLSQRDVYSYTDVNFILYNELGNYPILQTFGTMIHEKSIPYSPAIPDEYKRYTGDTFRLLIGDCSEESYVWASFSDQVMFKLPIVIATEFIQLNSAPAAEDEEEIENTEENEEIAINDTFEFYNTEESLIKYCDYFIDKFKTYEDFVTDAELDEDYSTWLKQSLEEIIDKDYSESPLESLVKIGNNNEEEPAYTGDMFADILGIFAIGSDSLFDEKIKEDILNGDSSILSGIDLESEFEDFDESARNKLENILTGEDEDYIARNINTFSTLSELTELNDTVLEYIAESLTDTVKTIHHEDIDASITYNKDTPDEYTKFINFEKFLYKLFYHFQDESELYNYVINPTSNGVLIDKIIESYAYGQLNNFKDSLLEYVANNTINATNDPNISKTSSLAYYYTINMFIYYSYIAGVVYDSFISYIHDIDITTDGVSYNDLYNLLYVEYIREAYPDAVDKICSICKAVATGLYSYFFEDSENTYSGKNAIVTATGPHRAEAKDVLTVENGEDVKKPVNVTDDEHDIPPYQKLIENIAQKLYSYAINDKTWVTKYTWKYYIQPSRYADKNGNVIPCDVEGRSHREYYFAVAAPAVQTITETDAETVGNNYEVINVFEGENYYVKPNEDMVNEGSLIAGQSAEETNIKNILPNLKDLVGKPYISAYIQPIWKAKVSIYALSKEDAKELFGEENSDIQYLCIEYSEAYFKWHFHKGEMIKLVFKSLTNTQYVIQSSYEVVGYDIEEGVVIVKGYINPAYIKSGAHEVWANLVFVEDNTFVSPIVGVPVEYDPQNPDIATILSQNEASYLASFNESKNVSEKKCKPLSRVYKHIYDNDEYISSNGLRGYENKPYRLPIRKITYNAIDPVTGEETQKTAWQYKVLFYLNGVFRSMQTYAVSPDEKVDMYISYAHNAYVDYTMKANSAKEYLDGTTKVNIDYDRESRIKMQFVDDTFVLNSKNFDINEGLYAWMEPESFDKTNTIPALIEKDMYAYTRDISYIPVEVDKDNSNIAFSVDVSNLGIDTKENYYVYWRVFRKLNTENNTKFLFESYNRTLYLDTQIPGIYDIEATVYDLLGNKVTKLFKGAYKIKK